MTPTIAPTEYEVRDFAKAAGVSIDQAREFIRKLGNNQQTLATAGKWACSPKPIARFAL